MERLIRVAARLDWINTKLGQTVAWLAIPLIVIVMFDVITRKSQLAQQLLPFESTALQEWEWHLHAVLFLFCAAYTYLNDGHVRVDIIRSRLGPVPQAWIEMIGAVFFLVPYAILMVYLGTQFVMDSYGLGETSDAPGGLGYRFLIKSALPIGFFFLALGGISTAIKNFVYLRTGERPQTIPPEDIIPPEDTIPQEGGSHVR